MTSNFTVASRTDAANEDGASSRGRSLLLFLLGTGIALFLQGVFSVQNGGPTALLHVGDDSELRGAITADLGAVELWHGVGHDGRFSYAIARSPFSFEGSGLDEPAYRYRRYLYSLVAGGFGQLGPWPTLYGLMLLAAVGFGLGAVGSAAVGRSLGVGRWSAVAGLVNLGVLSGVLQLSADPLAFGLAMVGAAAWLRDRRFAALLLFVLAVWSKEVYLLVPLGIAAWELWERRWTHAAVVVTVPATFGATWWVTLTALFPETSVTNSAFAPPFVGLLRAFELPGTGFSLGSQIITLSLIVVLSIATLSMRHRLLAALSGGWIVLALISHEQVLHQDSMRAFAPLFTFAFLASVLAVRHVAGHSALDPLGSPGPAPLREQEGTVDPGPATP